MQERHPLRGEAITKELLRPLNQTPMIFWVAVIILGGVLTAFAFAVGWMFYWGLGTTGLNTPIFWGFMITNFVFWIGISHAGVMISAILRLTQAEWRRPVTRAAEVMTIFSLMTAMLFPFLHTGRPWRTVYWVFPYDFERGVWPDPRGPLVWDPAAVFTYLTGSTLFLYTTLIPDMALLRDRSTGWRKTLYTILALGWRGNERQWKLQLVAGILLSALILPVFVSVHSIVSWDFAVSLIPVWHASIFAPYFVIGAVHSGVSAVITLMALMRWLFGFHNYLREEHFDSIGRLLVVVATGWIWFFLLDIIFAMFTRDPRELEVMQQRIFEWPYAMLLAFVFVFAYIIPVPVWMFQKFRRNIKIMFWTSLMVNVGMWAERYWLILPGLERKFEFTFMWSWYRPSIVELTLVFGSFALVTFLLLLFSKIFPPIAVWEEMEGVNFAQDIQVGKRTVHATIREE